MVPAVIGAVGTAQTVGSVAGGIRSALGNLGGVLSGNNNNSRRERERVQHAEELLRKALAGDVQAAADIAWLKIASTDVGRAANSEGWRQLLNGRPDVASRGLELSIAQHPDGFKPKGGGQGEGDRLRGEVTTFLDRVREEAARTVARVGSGAVDAAADAVGGPRAPTSSVIIPTDTRTLVWAGLGVAVVLIILLSRSRS